jgi:histidinol-phosphate aminotransferase
MPHNRRMALEFSAAVRRIPTYPAASAYAQSGPLVMLASNESPYPPIDEVVAAASAALAGVNRYPDPSYADLRGALSDRYGVPVERIAVGNGSCDILLAAGEALLEPGSELVHAWPSFSVYPQLEAASGARAIRVALDAQDRHDLDAMAAEVTVATRLVIVCNPNNPTSTAVELERIARFVESVPSHVCVLLDEAYCEFNLLDDPDASIALLERHPNLVLLRTFSKIYGLCGLRVGYALCGSRELPDALSQIRQPFFCNSAAQAAAVEALAHQDEVARRVERVVLARIEIEDGLRELGIEPAASQANFCWFELGENRDEEDVVRGLAEHGVIVRAGSALGRAGALRVTYGTPVENARFLEALESVLGAGTGAS